VVCGRSRSSGDPLSDGLLDSAAIAELAGFVEDEFGVVIDDDEMVPENFSSLDAFAALVDGKRTGTG
jgi:acyl carrier protein